jgi:hypothetical protein
MNSHLISLLRARWRARFVLAVVFAFAFACWASTAFAASVIHVAPGGSDAADGTAEQPLRSLPQAQRRARELRAKQPGEPLTIDVGAGSYVLTEPLVFTPEDSGASGKHPLTITGSGTVRISGGTRIEGFRPRDGHWVAAIPDSVAPFRDLWVNGRRAIRARAPNEGYYRIDAAGPDRRTSFTAESKDVLSIANPATAEVVYLHDWSVSRVGLKSIDSGKQTYLLAGSIGANYPFLAICDFEQHPRYFVENAIELLDAPGEWFLDAAKRELHYMPREGETIDEVKATAPRLSQLMLVRGTDQKPVQNIRFEGLSFVNTAFDLPRLGYAEIQANSYASRRDLTAGTTLMPPAAATLERAKNCSFENCRFEHLAAAGLHIAHSSKVRVERSTFSDLGGNGIMIGSMNEENPTAEGNVVENCTIERCGQTYFGGVGIWIGMAANTIVRNNEVRDLPYTGISVGWSWNPRPTMCRGNQIRYNHIHHVMQRLSDGGGIYTLGWQPGTTLVGNVIHDIPINAGRAESNGMFIDEGSTDLEIKENTIYRVVRSPIRFNMAGKNRIARNRLALTPGTPTFQYTGTKASDMTFVDNKVIENASWEPPAGDEAVKRAGPQR